MWTDTYICVIMFMFKIKFHLIFDGYGSLIKCMAGGLKGVCGEITNIHNSVGVCVGGWEGWG